MQTSSLLNELTFVTITPFVQCRSTSRLHPKTNQPLHFICTSLKQGETCVLAKEADLIDEGQKEAIAILDAVKKYCADCPKEWGSSLPESCFLESICIVTPWRKQVQVHVVGESTRIVHWGWARHRGISVTNCSIIAADTGATSTPFAFVYSAILLYDFMLYTEMI